MTIINLSLAIWGIRDHKTPLGGSKDPITLQLTQQLSPHGKITHAASQSREGINLTVLIATSSPVFTDFAR